MLESKQRQASNQQKPVSNFTKNSPSVCRVMLWRRGMVCDGAERLELLRSLLAG